MLSPGEVFAGRYRIHEHLAQGGMGIIYSAEHLATEEEVALKVLWPQVLGSKAAVESFQLEAKLANRVGSEHVVRVLDAGLDEKSGMPFLAMELLRGATLRALISKQGPLSPWQVIAIVRQAAKALDKAHGYVSRDGRPAPIVHRDLKPENVFVALREGTAMVKVLDFGIAKVLSETTEQSQEVRGTPLFMAYEQFTKGPITPRIDVWALGLIVFYLLSGRKYWLASAQGAAGFAPLLGEILTQPIAPPSERAHALGLAPNWPAAFDDWFLQCVNRQLEARFSSAGAAALALESALTFGAKLSKADIATARSELTRRVSLLLGPSPLNASTADSAVESTILSDEDSAMSVASGEVMSGAPPPRPVAGSWPEGPSPRRPVAGSWPEGTPPSRPDATSRPAWPASATPQTWVDGPTPRPWGDGSTPRPWGDEGAPRPWGDGPTPRPWGDEAAPRPRVDVATPSPWTDAPTPSPTRTPQPSNAPAARGASGAWPGPPAPPLASAATSAPPLASGPPPPARSSGRAPLPSFPETTSAGPRPLASPFAMTAPGGPPPPGVFEPASSPTGASRTMPFNTVSSSVPLDSTSTRSFRIRTSWLAAATVMLVGLATFGAWNLRNAKLSGNADVASSTSSLSASPSAKVVPVRAPPTPPSENAVPSSALPPTPPSAKAEQPAASEPGRGATPTVPSQAAAASPTPSTAGRGAGVEKRSEAADGKKVLSRELSLNRQGNPPAEKRPDAKKPDEKKTEGASAAGASRTQPAPAPAEPTPSKGMYERR